jgi:UDP-glucose 4-epimerase
MKILVTGASGFIGRNLLPVQVNQSETNTVFAVVRQMPKDAHPNVNWIVTDLGISDWTKSLPDEDFDAIIHLAQSKRYREFPNQAIDIFNINVKATVELAEWTLRHRVKRFLFASTGNVYGSKDCAHREEDRCVPETMYGASKLSAEILLKPFSEFMDVLVLRLFGVYGPGQRDVMLPWIIQLFNAGSEITLAGNVGVKFNPIYIDDCVSIIHRLTAGPTSTGYEILNIGGAEIIDLRQVSELLENLGGKKALTRITTDCPKQLVGSIEKLRQSYGVTEGVPFLEGLRRTFHSFKEASKTR